MGIITSACRYRPAFIATVAVACVVATVHADSTQREPHGAIFRGDTSTKQIALLFTGDELGESTAPILDALAQRGIKASFFVTGNYLRNPAYAPLLKRIVDEGHYLGPHSDAHRLYCSWDNREESLITKQEFTSDLARNIDDLRSHGALAPGDSIYFVPPFEWYNRDHVAWCDEVGVKLINFTPGSGSNRDYAPEGDKRFVSSQEIYDDILAYEQKDPHGLSGFLLLLHLGSGRRDPFHTKLGPLCDELRNRGYDFARVDEALQ